MRHHAVDTDDGQGQPENREDRQQHEVEARPRVHELVEKGLHRSDIGHGLIAIELVHLLDDGTRHGDGVTSGLHEQTVRGAEKGRGEIDLGHDGIHQAVVERVADDADDLDAGVS